ncbi:DUF4132 domain-containing protein [Iodobacter fluviatilis]|uniref:MolR family transcriptional regulator n=1 Tax=Iodobacter fluviatilis TaxID=537 RepID=A0A7G3GF12_9NEIS|nr:DUF4132 domain-containing protein [Iodobacter fluviatilis]QBC45926.1 MolR family transcriptional regulator [Iodobacter fluviatilis]
MNKSTENNTQPWLSETDELPLTKKQAEAILPSRRNPGKTAKLNAHEAWQSFRQTLLAHDPASWQHQHPSDELATAFDEATALLQQAEPAPASDAAYAILLRRAMQWSARLQSAPIHGWDSSTINAVAAWQVCMSAIELFRLCSQFLLATLGYERTLGIVLQALRFRLELQNDSVSISREFFYEAVTQSNTYEPSLLNVLTGDLTLRCALAQADEAVWLRCVEQIQAAFDSQHVLHRIYLLWLLPDCHDWVKAETLALCQSPLKIAHWFTPLLTIAPDRETVQALRTSKAFYILYDGFSQLLRTHGVIGVPTNWSTWLPNLVQQLGMDALPEIIRNYDETTVRNWLGTVNHPLVLRSLAERAGQDNTALEHFSKACQRWPLTAIAVLADLLSTKTDKKLPYAKQWRDLLDQLLQQNADAATQLQAWISVEAHTFLLQRSKSTAAKQVFAANEKLPAVLANPPWLSQQTRSEMPVFTLDVLPLDPIERWDAQAKQRFLSCPSYNEHYWGGSTDFEWAQKAIDNTSPESILAALGFRPYETRSDSIRLSNEKKRQHLLEALNAGDIPELALRMEAKDVVSRISSYALPLLSDEQALWLWNEYTPYRLTDTPYPMAVYGLRALPGLLKRVTQPNSALLPVTLYLGALELAAIMARKYRGKVKSQRELGQQWLLNFPEHSITALLPAALGTQSEAQDEARLALRLLREHGYAELIRQCAARYSSDDVMAAAEAFISEDPLDRFPSKISKMPAYWQPCSWRRPVLASNGKAIPDSAAEHLATMLRFPLAGGRYAGLDQVSAACTRDSLADFIWDAFQNWLTGGSPSKDSVIFQHLAPYANDETTRKLGTLVRQWSSDSIWVRAIAGLDMLTQIGTDVALLQINSIAFSCKKKTMQERAKEKIAQIAEERGLTVAEMEDRLAPDMGLDQNGSLRLDFGPRHFTLSFDETLKPFVRDTEGLRLADLPKPRKTDDEAMAKVATLQFKGLKKDVKTIASQQIRRLEQAMCQRRRWPVAVFAEFLAQHPLIRHLVQRLVWAVYPINDDTPLCLFRVAEDASYSDAQDDALTLPEGEICIGLPHPLDISAEDLAAFGQLFADYELLQPFPQLSRPVYRLNAEEAASNVLLRWNGKTTPSGRALGLTNKAWIHGSVENMNYQDFVLPLQNGVSLRLDISPGVPLFAREAGETQTVEKVSLNRNINEVIPFGSLDAITSSELVHELEMLTQ